MEKRNFSGIGEDISLLGFGLMRLPVRDPARQSEVDYEKAEQMLDLAVQAGVNYFDTAYIYHEGASELFAGRALSRYPRQSYNLADKMPSWLLEKPADLERIFSEQLDRCRADYFDFYLVHRISSDTYPAVLATRAYEFLREKKEQGLIRHLGFSFHDTPPLLREVLDKHDWDFAQIQFNYLDWQDLQAKEQYELLAGRDLPVVIMEPVRGGALASLSRAAEAKLKAAEPDMSIASWAIRFAASFPKVLTVLSGMSDLAQMKDNLATMQNFRPLGPKDMDLVFEAAAMFRASSTIPCTGCRYCMDCPAGVDIPKVFAVYNQHLLKKMRRLFDIYYTYLKDSEKADKCVGCGACRQRCPQGIDIPSHMKEIADFAAQK
ncbi:MAG: aldo/keto reductase [Deltaproteobacteria bacterium]|jgi:predicted aldo/keto reductase-like oxidoreductase|nr:aldo/keto reductase [Deltaproteobacteria bacterium]